MNEKEKKAFKVINTRTRRLLDELEMEKEDIELDIEAKYVDKTEKEFLSKVTYAECLYILTPKNKYCDKIRELSVLKLCEIIEKLQKENEELKRLMAHKNGYTKLLEEDLFENCSNYVIPIQTIKGKIWKLFNKDV